MVAALAGSGSFAIGACVPLLAAAVARNDVQRAAAWHAPPLAAAAAAVEAVAEEGEDADEWEALTQPPPWPPAGEAPQPPQTPTAES